MNTQALYPMLCARRTALLALAASAAFALLSGCASTQSAALLHADKVYAEASSDPALTQNARAAEYLRTAEAALEEAKRESDRSRFFGEATSLKEIETQAYVAEQNVLAAKAVASSQAADTNIAVLQAQREQALIAKRDREAAQEAQRLAQLEQERRTAELNAALERAKARGAEVATTGEQIKVTFRNVTFDFNKAQIKPEFQASLDELAAALKARYPNAKVEISGYTDNTGNEQYNAQLSEQRASAVKTFLISKGLPADRLATRGLGAQNPVASNTTPEGRAQNRRVEVAVTGIEGQ